MEKAERMLARRSVEKGGGGGATGGGKEGAGAAGDGAAAGGAAPSHAAGAGAVRPRDRESMSEIVGNDAAEEKPERTPGKSVRG